MADNGHGVAPENYAALTAKYHTSKIANFSDLQVCLWVGGRRVGASGCVGGR